MARQFRDARKFGDTIREIRGHHTKLTEVGAPIASSHGVVGEAVAAGVPLHVMQRATGGIRPLFAEADFQFYRDLLPQWCRCDVPGAKSGQDRFGVASILSPPGLAAT